MRVSNFFKHLVFAILAATLSSGAFAARESFKAQSLIADQAYGGSIVAVPVSGSAQVFTYSFGGGIARTDDGISWAPKNNGLTSLSLRSLQVNALLASHVYAATSDGAGFYKSTDSGNTWTALAAGTGLNCRNVQFLNLVNNSTTPASPHLFASTGCPGAASGLYKSEDGGATWQQVPLGLPVGATAQGLNIFAQNGTTMAYSARASTSVGQYQTTNGGTGFAGTWASINGTGMSGPVGLNGLYSFNTSNATNGSFVMAVVAGKGIYRTPAAGGVVSTSGSAVWSQVLGSGAAPKTPVSAIFQRFFGASPDQNRYVTIDGEGSYVSTNNGASWVLDPLLSFSKQIRNIARDSVTLTTFWGATYHGLYKSTDSMVTWTKVTAAGLPGAFLSRVIQPDSANPQYLLSAGSVLQQSSDGGASWSINPDVPHLSFASGDLRSANTSGSLVFAATSNGGIYRSTNSGVNWTQLPFLLTGTLGPIGRTRLYTGSGSAAVYAAVGQTGLASAAGGSGGFFDDRFDTQKFGLYRTLDTGNTWSLLLTGSVVGSVNAVAAAPGAPNTLMAATASGLFKTTDGGANWRLVGPVLVYPSANNVSGGTVVSAGAVVSGGAIVTAGAAAPGVGFVDYDPLNANNLLATAYDVDAFNRATALSGGYRSRDGGETWEAVVTHEKLIGFRFVTVNGKSIPYIVSRGFFDQETEQTAVFRCPEVLTLASGDLMHLQCTPLTLEATVDGKAAIPNSLTIPPGATQPIGIATQTMGFQKFARTNIGPDFNNDGIADVFLRNAGMGQNFIWQLSEGPNSVPFVNPTTSAFSYSLPGIWDFAGSGDFNGDGNTDILWRNTSTGDNGIHFMDSTTTLLQSNYIRTVPTAWVVAGVGDFNGDGVSDILWRNTATGENYIYMMNGTAIIGEGYVRTVPLTWIVAGVGDYDGDGKSDILLRNTSTGENYIYFMNGTSITSEGYTRTVPTAWSVAGVGDFDGNGKTDILWRNTTTGENYLYYMNGTAIATEGYLPTVSDLNWQVKGVAEYSGNDGKAEILWSNSTLAAGQNNVWRLNGLVPQSICGALGCAAGTPLPNAPAGWLIVNK